ncbi:MAG: hypothetical protein UH963_10870 [Agathobacter sp.]|nr:hypothetical protein [Agathobacter sp.]
MEKNIKLANIYIKIHNKDPLTMADMEFLSKYDPECFAKTCKNLAYEMPEVKSLMNFPDVEKPHGITGNSTVSTDTRDSTILTVETNPDEAHSNITSSMENLKAGSNSDNPLTGTASYEEYLSKEKLPMKKAKSYKSFEDIPISNIPKKPAAQNTSPGYQKEYYEEESFWLDPKYEKAEKDRVEFFLNNLKKMELNDIFVKSVSAERVKNLVGSLYMEHLFPHNDKDSYFEMYDDTSNTFNHKI